MFPRLAFSVCFAATSMFIAHSALAAPFKVKGTAGSILLATPHPVGGFNQPWSMTFLPGEELLVATKPGKLWLVKKSDKKFEVHNVPPTYAGGQGGLGDVVLHPDFEQNNLVYLNLVDSLDNGKSRGSIVVRGKLERGSNPRLIDVEKIWTQTPKLQGRGHFSHRLAFGPKGTVHEGKLFITSGDRQALAPAQRWDMALGKIIRLNDDGSVPNDNPYQNKGSLAKSFWSTGHRNPLGIAFAPDNQLWSNEMGPAHGDELNIIEPGKNYGWPVVSEGDHYSGEEIPNHDTRPDFEAPKTAWVPSIAPSGLIIYSGKKFPDWNGDALIGGLRGRALVRVDVKGKTAREAERFEWGKRIREVEQGPNGNIWVLEDRSGGRLISLSPSN